MLSGLPCAIQWVLVVVLSILCRAVCLNPKLLTYLITPHPSLFLLHQDHLSVYLGVAFLSRKLD